MSRIIIPAGLKRRRVPEAGYCPDCHEKMDAASSPTGRMPEPGDWSVCAMCGCIMRFGEDLEVRRATEDELNSVPERERDALLAYSKRFCAARKIMTAPKHPDILAVPLPPLPSSIESREPEES